MEGRGWREERVEGGEGRGRKAWREERGQGPLSFPLVCVFPYGLLTFSYFGICCYIECT